MPDARDPGPIIGMTERSAVETFSVQLRDGRWLAFTVAIGRELRHAMFRRLTVDERPFEIVDLTGHRESGPAKEGTG